jgi:hypothetical protein
MEYGLIAGLVILSVIVALYFNRKDLQTQYDDTSVIETEQSDDISGMTKKELQEYALSKYGTKLSSSMKKQDMIDSIVNMDNEI